MSTHTSINWQDILVANNLNNFESIWSLEAPWFEEPNRRRGGWSGVCRLELQNPAGGTVAVFLKRQLNHMHKTIAHPLRGETTFSREFHNMQRCEEAGVPVAELVYFAEREDQDGKKAILITKALDTYQPLYAWANDLQPVDSQIFSLRRGIINAVAQVVRQLHSKGLQHGCLHDKHIFVQVEEATQAIDVRIIDLEMLKWRPDRAKLRDLYALHRHTPGWTLNERLYFYKKYLNINKLNAKNKSLWRRLSQRYQAKMRKKLAKS